MLEQDFHILADLLARQGGFDKEEALCRKVHSLISVKRENDAELFMILNELILHLGPVAEWMRAVQKTLMQSDPELYSMIGMDIDTLLPQLEKCMAPMMDLATDESYYMKHPAVRIPLALAFYYGVGRTKNYQYAHDILRFEANSGNCDACALLAKLRFKLHIPLLDAKVYMKKAAEAGVADAQFMLGDAYQMQQDTLRAIDYYNRAARQEHAGALYRLYRLEVEKTGSKSRSASKLLDRAVSAGSMAALEIKGRYILEKTELRSAEKTFLIPACHGYWKAQVYLAYIYDYVGKQQAALKWCAYAAGQKNINAQEMLGHLYEAGRLNLEQNSRRAEMWYMEAIRNKDQQNNPHICDAIRAHLLHRWWNQDEWKYHAHDIHEFLTEINLDQYPDIETLLGDLYARGADALDYRKDLGKARTHYEAAANHGNIRAMMKAADYELNGWGGGREPQQAIQYLKTAAELGNAQAALRLGNILSSATEGVINDQESAARYYEQAALADSVDACVRFADCCFSGEGTQQSYNKAVMYYKKAIAYHQKSNLLPHAHAQLAKCYRDGLGVKVSHRESFKHQLLAGDVTPDADWDWQDESIENKESQIEASEDNKDSKDNRDSKNSKDDSVLIPLKEVDDIETTDEKKTLEIPPQAPSVIDSEPKKKDDERVQLISGEDSLNKDMPGEKAQVSKKANPTTTQTVPVYKPGEKNPDKESEQGDDQSSNSIKFPWIIVGVAIMVLIVYLIVSH